MWNIVIFFIVVIVVIIIMTANHDIKDEDLTKPEKIGKATGKVLGDLAGYISDSVGSITESAEHKERRENNEIIIHQQHTYLSSLLGPHDPKGDYDRDERLRNALIYFGISKEDWIRSSLNLIRFSPIYEREELINKSRFSDNTPSQNKIALEENSALQQSLEYFNIPVEDWIKFGTKVIVMYDLYKRVGLE